MAFGSTATQFYLVRASRYARAFLIWWSANEKAALKLNQQFQISNSTICYFKNPLNRTNLLAASAAHNNISLITEPKKPSMQVVLFLTMRETLADPNIGPVSNGKGIYKPYRPQKGYNGIEGPRGWWDPCLYCWKWDWFWDEGRGPHWDLVRLEGQFSIKIHKTR